MKILYVSNLYGDNSRGGAERIVEQEARAMSAAGHDVTVLRAERGPAVSKGERKAGEPRLLGMTVPNLYFYSDDHKYGTLTRLAWHVLDTFNLPSALAFRKILDREKPDVVHTHNLMGLGFMIPAMIRAAAVARKRRGEPKLLHVHTVHDVQLLHPSGLLSPLRGGTEHEAFHLAGPMRAVYQTFMRLLLGSPEKVVFPSTFLSSLHAQKGYFPHSKRIVLGNPAPEARTTPRAKPASLSFLFVGQIEVHKGVHVLADAWEESGLQSRQATLTFVGDGVKAERLRARTASMAGVSAPGKMQGEALAVAYDNAAFLVVPSIIIENYPTVILEAFSHGTPVVGAVTGGIPEMVHENVNGFLFAVGSAQDCADALKRAADSPDWERLSAAALQWARENGVEKHVAALKEIYA